MTFPCRIRRVVLIHQRIDFRKQWNGLLAEARRLGFEPYDGDLLVFVKRDKTQLRAISGDRRGLFILSRRFEGGSLRFQFGEKRQEISEAELAMWLEGSHFEVVKKCRIGNKYLDLTG